MSGEGYSSAPELTSVEEAYFRSNGMLPPTVEEGTSSAVLSARIETLRRIGSGIIGNDGIGHEIEYLSQRLEEMNREEH